MKLLNIYPSSFHILDEILSIEKLIAVEINKDVGVPSVTEMLPVFKKVLKSGKRLILWGDLDESDILFIKSELPPAGIFLNIVTENIEKAKHLVALTVP